MRVTIIADDGKVGVDRVFRSVDLSTLDPNIHAVQWDGATGHIEFKDRSPNKMIDDFSAFQPFVAAWTAAAPPPPPPPPPPPSKAEIIDGEIARSETLAGLIGEVAALKGVTKAQLIADIKVSRGA